MGLYGGGLVGLVFLGLWVFCVFDAIGAEESLIRNLPKTLWIFIVLLLPPIGPIAWLIMGRPLNTKFRPGSTEYRETRPPLGVEDTPEYKARIERLKLERWEDDLKRRESELKKTQEPPPDDSDGDPSAKR